MGRRKEPEYKPHPLLEELRPRLKASARKYLERSLLRVGQLHPILATMDYYILDGRERFELMQSMGLKPKINQLNFYSGVDQKALPNAGFSLEEEFQSCLEVIEETGRGKWLNSQARREDSSSNSSGSSDSSNSSDSSCTVMEAVALFVCSSPEPVTRAQAEQHFGKTYRGLCPYFDSLLKANRIRLVKRGKAPLYWRP